MVYNELTKNFKQNKYGNLARWDPPICNYLTSDDD